MPPGRLASGADSSVDRGRAVYRRASGNDGHERPTIDDRTESEAGKDVTDVFADRIQEHVIQLLTEEGKRSDGDDGDERQDQCVLGEALSAVSVRRPAGSSVVLNHTMRRAAQSARAPNVLRSVSIVSVSDGGQIAYEPGRRPSAGPRSDGTERPFLAATARMMMMRVPAQDAMPLDSARAPLGRYPSFVFGCPRMDECACSATGAYMTTRVQATTTYPAGSADGMALMSHWGRSACQDTGHRM